MKRTERERKAAAKDFSNFWKGKGYEKGESQLFWTSLLTDVFGVSDPKRTIAFESKVKLDHTSFIDGYIESTHVLIEQKSINKDLLAPIRQSDGSELTPYEQAKRYANELAYSERPRWIVVSNFKEFHIYDMEHPQQEAHVIPLEELPARYHELDFLVDADREEIIQEQEISVKAGELVGRLYDLLLAQYADQKSPDTFRSLNRLCVRIVFCLYAEDSGLFSSHLQFHDYLKQFNPGKMRKGLIELFEALNTSPEDRDPYMDEDLAAFPYVSGGLFEGSNDNIIPQFTKEIADLLLDKASAGFDWSEISPTIFGAVFESTLNPVTRHDGGMHYTSVENIHKVTDPLFMDALNNEFVTIKTGSYASDKTRKKKLLDFQEKLSNVRVLDPACGSGNFLTQTYIDLRLLENKVVEELTGGQALLGMDEFDPIKVGIGQFYGIEINDFAVTVAMTALWIAEAQMLKATENIIKRDIEFFPLKSYANIQEGNALRMDWHSVVPNTDITYIVGNPPFLGYTVQSDEQKADLALLGGFGKNVDYVAGWYWKACEYMKGTPIKAAFVSTNSICQGEQVSSVWKPLFDTFDPKIIYAYHTFRWDSDSQNIAHVHCVIVGFTVNGEVTERFIFDGDQVRKVEKINGYLIEGDSIAVEGVGKSLFGLPECVRGSQPTDDGNFIFTEIEKDEFLKVEPKAKPLIRPFMMGKDFIQRKPRYCLWLKDADPLLVDKCKKVKERINAVKEFRLASNKAATRLKAMTPMLFDEIKDSQSDYVSIPIVSSEKRSYVPMGWLSKDVIAGNKLFMVANAELFHFALLTSSVHMAWMRAVCGRLENRYSYSNTIVYNTFPVPKLTDSDKAKLSKCAKAIIDARSLYPETPFSALYNDLTMPVDLRKAHIANDKAVKKAYGFDESLSEAEIVAKLMSMYVAKAKEVAMIDLAEKAVLKVVGVKNKEDIPTWLKAMKEDCILGKLSPEELITEGKAKLKAEKAAARKAEKAKKIDG